MKQIQQSLALLVAEGGVQGPHKAHHLAHRHPAIDLRRFRDIADSLLNVAGVVKDIEPQHADRSARRTQQPHDHPQRRALARSVGSQSSQHRPARDHQVQPFNGRRSAVSLAQRAQLNRRLLLRRTDLFHGLTPDVCCNRKAVSNSSRMREGVNARVEADFDAACRALRRPRAPRRRAPRLVSDRLRIHPAHDAIQ